MVVRAVVKEGVGVRQASRIFRLSPKTVIARIEDFSKKVLGKDIDIESPVVELDKSTGGALRDKKSRPLSVILAKR